MPQAVQISQLRPSTLQTFEAYVREAEAAMEQTLGSGMFLWSDRSPDRAKHVRKGQTIAEPWSTNGPAKATHGLIHDWIGALFVPSVSLVQTLALMQDYDNHKSVFKPEVIDSRLISRNGSDFEIYLRLLKKKVVTVVLDTFHQVHYSALDANRCVCRSFSTQVQEVEHPGTPKETRLPPDTGYGFLWRLNSYWRLMERDGGLYLQCRAISLTRDVPTGLGWIIDPIIRKLPRESLIHTLTATRDGVIVRQSI